MKQSESFGILFSSVLSVNPMVWDINRFTKGKAATFSVLHHAGQRYLSLLCCYALLYL